MRTPARRSVVAVATLAAASAVLTVLPLSGVTASAGERPAVAAPTPRAATAAVRAWRAAAPVRLVVGSSVRGRQIVALRQGPADAPLVVLVLGQMHGSEPKGRAVVRALRRLAPPGRVQVWSIVTVNPDGAVRGTRRNSRKVDLNRNFPHRWRSVSTRSIYYPGRQPASEPESRRSWRSPTGSGPT